MWSRSCQRTSFGATIASEGESSSTPASRARASGSGAVSCASSQSALSGSTRSAASFTAFA